MTLAEIKKLLGSKNLIVGTGETIKGLRKNKVKKVWLSSNVPNSIQKDIQKYTILNNVKLHKLKIPNDELGIICKKQFYVSIVSEGEK